MNTELLFEKAKAAGIAPFEVRISTGSKLQITTFNDQVENLTVADDASVRVRGLVGGKCGTFSSDNTSDDVIDVAVAAVAEAAEYGQPVNPDYFIRKGDYEYEKVDTFNAALDAVPATRFTALAKEIGKKATELDKRIESASVQVEYVSSSRELKNSNGLELCGAENYVMIYCGTKAVDGEKVESGSYYEILTALDGFDANAFAEKAVADAMDRLGGETVASGKYKVVYSSDVAAALLTAVKNGFSAFDVEQNVSLLKDKVGTKVFSELLTVEETSIGSEPFCGAFDDEGVATSNKLLIDKGVVTDYVYDLATAERAVEGRKSTGNGRLMGTNIRPAVTFMTVKPNADCSFEHLAQTVGDGIYITDVSGVGTGLNGQSGDYSLQASGYRIERGKITSPVSLITVAGNVIKDFANIGAIGNDMKLTYYGIKCPSVMINEIAVSGK